MIFSFSSSKNLNVGEIIITSKPDFLDARFDIISGNFLDNSYRTLQKGRSSKESLYTFNLALSDCK